MHRSWKQHAAKGSNALLLLHACPRRLCGNSPGRIDTSCLSKMTVSKMCRKKYINIYIYLFSLQTGPLLYLSTLGTIHLCPMLAAVPFSRWLPPACTSLCSLLKCSYFAREPLHPPPKKKHIYALTAFSAARSCTFMALPNKRIKPKSTSRLSDPPPCES